MGLCLCVARPTNDINKLLTFYCNGLGFEIIYQFHDHEGFDGIMLGKPDCDYHLEFTSKKGHDAGRAPTQDNLLVFYIPDRIEWENAIQKMVIVRYEPVISFNPYWDIQGKTFEDPDRYRVVLQQSAWPPEK